MTAVGIIDIFDAIKRSNGDYCKVCFRTAQERKLVAPVSFKLFLNAMNGCSPFKTEVKVCYVCEALASSALKFIRAVELGASVEELYMWIETEGLRNVVIKHLNGTMKSANRACHQAAECEAGLRRSQCAMPHTLHRTDTLLVATEVISDRSTKSVFSTKNAKSTAATDDEVYIVIDDDAPPAPAPARAQARAAPCAGAVPMVEQMAVQVKDADTNNFVLHPMVEATDGNIYVPSLRLKLLNNQILESIPDNDLFLYTDAPAPEVDAAVKKNKRQRFASAMEEAKNDRGDTMLSGYYNFLKEQSELASKNNHKKRGKNQLVQTEKSNNKCDVLDSYGKKISEAPRIDDSITVSDEDISAKSGVVERGGSGNQTGASDCDRGVKKDSLTESKQPVPSMDRVDWEDKIPMDVISFMDATDPNPTERIMQPNAPPAAVLGVISDVRTVEEDVDVQIVENVECIDLC